MSLDRFGNVVPIQAEMLSLAGYHLSRGYSGLDIPEAERLENVRRGREELRLATGQDYGYDLAAWHEFLEAFAEYGYAHPYAYDRVRQAVLQAVDDPERGRLVRLLESDA